MRVRAWARLRVKGTAGVKVTRVRRIRLVRILSWSSVVRWTLVRNFRSLLTSWVSRLLASKTMPPGVDSDLRGDAFFLLLNILC